MLASLAAFWAGLPQWMRDAIKVAGIVLGVVFLGKAYGAAKKNEGRQDERKRQEIETAKERERVIETSHTVIKEIEDAKDAAIAAPHSVPVVSGPDELRKQAPAIAKVILRDRR